MYITAKIALNVHQVKKFKNNNFSLPKSETDKHLNVVKSVGFKKCLIQVNCRNLSNSHAVI